MDVTIRVAIMTRILVVAQWDGNTTVKLGVRAAGLLGYLCNPLNLASSHSDSLIRLSNFYLSFLCKSIKFDSASVAPKLKHTRVKTSCLISAPSSHKFADFTFNFSASLALLISCLSFGSGVSPNANPHIGTSIHLYDL